MNGLQNKNLIGISALILALGLSYYFAISLPQKNKEISLNQNIEKCQDLGAKNYQMELKKDSWIGNTIAHLTYDDHEYKYNKKLATCLYRGGYKDLLEEKYYIVDLYTNKEIAHFSQPNDPKEWARNEKNGVLYGTLHANFDSKVEELFKN